MFLNVNFRARMFTPPNYLFIPPQFQIPRNNPGCRPSCPCIISLALNFYSVPTPEGHLIENVIANKLLLM